MIRTLQKNNAKAEYTIVGARAQSSNEDIAVIVLANYDDDTKLTYKMAEIAIRDQYGTSNENGIGNMMFRTGQTDRLTILHNGYIGIQSLKV